MLTYQQEPGYIWSHARGQDLDIFLVLMVNRAYHAIGAQQTRADNKEQ